MTKPTRSRKHLSLVPPVAEVAPEAPILADMLVLFQAATGICLCRACAKERHPAYGSREVGL